MIFKTFQLCLDVLSSLNSSRIAYLIDFTKIPLCGPCSAPFSDPSSSTVLPSLHVTLPIPGQGFHKALTLCSGASGNGSGFRSASAPLGSPGCLISSSAPLIHLSWSWSCPHLLSLDLPPPCTLQFHMPIFPPCPPCFNSHNQAGILAEVSEFQKGIRTRIKP